MTVRDACESIAAEINGPKSELIALLSRCDNERVPVALTRRLAKVIGNLEGVQNAIKKRAIRGHRT